MMTTSTIPHVRPIDPARDMPEVLDLIEIGFRDELDPQGWKMLDQMRRIYQPNALTSMVYSRAGDTAGFVARVDGRVVGNLSLRNALPYSSHGRLIGNVVVHPDFRGHGIGHRLMERALEAAREQRARWVGLEVRADNVVACRLYEGLGFRVVGATEHLVRPGDVPWPAGSAPDSAWRASKPRHSTQWHRLANLVYDADQRRVLEVRPNIYTFGSFERRLNLILSGQWERAWIHDGPSGEPDMAAHVQIDRRYKFHAWDILMHPDAGPEGAKGIIAKCLSPSRRFPPWPVVTQVASQESLTQALYDIGFALHRTLQQMLLAL